MKKLLGIVLALIAMPAMAADMATKAINNALSTGYPTKCGYYFGMGTGGSAGAVDGAVVGTQIVQGELDALVGYTCPFAQNAFWFVEGSVGFNNINGSVNGLALSGDILWIWISGQTGRSQDGLPVCDSLLEFALLGLQRLDLFSQRQH